MYCLPVLQLAQACSFRGFLSPGRVVTLPLDLLYLILFHFVILHSRFWSVHTYRLESFIPDRDNSPDIGAGAAQIVELLLLKINHQLHAHSHISSEGKFDGLVRRFLVGV